MREDNPGDSDENDTSGSPRTEAGPTLEGQIIHNDAGDENTTSSDGEDSS